MGSILSTLLSASLVIPLMGAPSFAQTPERHSSPTMIVEPLVHEYGPFELKPDRLQQYPPIMEFTFPEDIWLVGYEVRMTDPHGQRLARELQCHTFLGTSMPAHHVHEEVVGIFSDGYTEEFELPVGYGIFFKGGEKILWNPMFNNRNDAPKMASMRLTLNVVRARNLNFKLTPLKTTFRSLRSPGDIYYVSPGKDVRETTFKLPFTGKIHAMGTHIHPYGVSIQLYNVTKNEMVWTALGKKDERGNLVEMPKFESSSGYSVGKDDEFKLIATYENTTTKPVDAMAGVFILYDESSTIN